MIPIGFASVDPALMLIFMGAIAVISIAGAILYFHDFFKGRK